MKNMLPTVLKDLEHPALFPPPVQRRSTHNRLRYVRLAHRKTIRTRGRAVLPLTQITQAVTQWC